MSRTTRSAIPGLSGTARTDQVLTISNPAVSPAVGGVTFTYQWYRYSEITLKATKITGATSPSYRVTPTDAIGSYQLYALVTPKKTGWLSAASASQHSGATTLADYAGTYSMGAPTYDTSTHALVGHFDHSGITTAGVTYAYQWFRKASNGSATKITGATGTTYKTTKTGEYHLEVRISKPGYYTTTVFSTWMAVGGA